MRDLFHIVRTVASEIDDVTVLFSTGKDSIVTLDLCAKYFKKITAVYLYTVKGISYREEILNYYARRYNMEVRQYPQIEVSYLLSNGVYGTSQKVRKVRQADMEALVRKDTGNTYCAYGNRKSESLARRAWLGSLEMDGVDRKTKRVFPVSEWNDRDIMAWIKKEKLPLPVEYSYGFRNIDIYCGKGLLWLYQNYPDDYAKVERVYPNIGGELLRAREMYG